MISCKQKSPSPSPHRDYKRVSRIAQLSVLSSSEYLPSPIELAYLVSYLKVRVRSRSPTFHHVELRLRQEDLQRRKLRLQLQGVRAHLRLRDNLEPQDVLRPSSGGLEGCWS